MRERNIAPTYKDAMHQLLEMAELQVRHQGQDFTYNKRRVEVSTNPADRAYYNERAADNTVRQTYYQMHVEALRFVIGEVFAD